MKRRSFADAAAVSAEDSSDASADDAVVIDCTDSEEAPCVETRDRAVRVRARKQLKVPRYEYMVILSLVLFVSVS